MHTLPGLSIRVIDLTLHRWKSRKGRKAIDPIASENYGQVSLVLPSWKFRTINTFFQVTKRHHLESEQSLLCFVFFRELIVWKKADSIIHLIILLIMRTGKC